MSKFMGANLSFNNQWTVIESTKDREGIVVKWSFTCGCGHDSDYAEKQFLDPYAAAVTAMEFHSCEV